MPWATAPHLDGPRLSGSIVGLAKGGRVQRPGRPTCRLTGTITATTLGWHRNWDIGDNRCMPFGCRESTCNIWCDLKKERHLNQPLCNGKLAHQYAHRLPQLASWPVGQSVYFSIGQSVSWQVGWLASWPISQLVSWAAGQLIS